MYGLVGNELNPAIIFSGLQFFNVLRMPISELPMILTSVIDAVVALKRIGGLLVVSRLAPHLGCSTDRQAGELKSGLPINAGTPLAVDVQGSFEFEAADDEQEQDADGDEKQAPGGDGLMGREADSALPFTLSDIKLAIPKGWWHCREEGPDLSGALVCIVGRVGTGKSALLSGLINEMRQTKGKTIFGGSVSYGQCFPLAQRLPADLGSSTTCLGAIRHDHGQHHFLCAHRTGEPGQGRPSRTSVWAGI